MLTEDMDITWKLQLRGWDVRFEPRALAWILMPETASGLWKQRLRWAMGGLQIIGKYKSIFRDWRTYPVWPLFLEHILSITWACSVAAVLLVYGFDLSQSIVQFIAEKMTTADIYSSVSSATSTNDTAGSMTTLLPSHSGVIIGTTCLLQMLISMLIESRYDHQLLRNYVWTIWYPLGFWTVNLCTIIVAIPKTLLRKAGLRARWTSPDRGIAHKL